MPRENGKREFAGSHMDVLLNDRELDLAVNFLLFLLENRRGSDVGLRRLLEAFERSIIARVLFACNGNQAQAARNLHLRPTTLNEKLKKFGILAEIRRRRKGIIKQILAADRGS